MTLDQFEQVLQTCGSDPQSWPAPSRTDCESLLRTDPQAQQLHRSYQQLDASLDALPAVAFPGLEQRVLHQALPARKPQPSSSPVDRLLEWLLPQSGAPLWRPALAACLPLVFGIVIGNFYSFGIGNSGDGFRNWDDELLMLSFNEYSDSQEQL